MGTRERWRSGRVSLVLAKRFSILAPPNRFSEIENTADPFPKRVDGSIPSFASKNKKLDCSPRRDLVWTISMEDKTEFSKWLEVTFPKQKFSTASYKVAGRKFKKDPGAAKEFLQSRIGESTFKFQAPAKCRIVGQSRPFDQWPIVQAAQAVQRHVFGLVKNEAEKKPQLKIDVILQWVADNNIDLHGFRSSQGLNGIVNRAFAMYHGVVSKVDNRNKSRKDRIDRINKSRAENKLSPLATEFESAFNDEHKLINPPGLNPSIYCYQQISPSPIDMSKDCKVLEAAGFSTYKHEPILRRGKRFFDRLKIAKGQPGYVPIYHRAGLNPQKRLRYYGDGGEILAIIKVDTDWVLFDLRGLLRNVHWRRLSKFEMTVEELLKLFTGDPVIDVKRNEVVFMFKAGILEITSKDPISYRNRKTLNQSNAAGVVSIDLGKNKPLAAKISKLKIADDKLSADHLERISNEDLGVTFDSLHQAHDLLEQQIKDQALGQLSQEEQDQVRELEHYSAAQAKSNVKAKYSLQDKDVDWNKISTQSTLIADAALQKNPKAEVWVQNESEKVKMRDTRIARSEDIRPKLPGDLRQKFNKLIWDLKKENTGYWRLAKRKAETARYLRNALIRRAEEKCGGPVILNLEDLSSLKIFHGNGKRDLGWDALFLPKQEGRWLMQALHKAITELATNRGATVVLSSPQRTSITCTSCGHCDSSNRNGEKFHCLKCDFKAHADLEIATDNLEKVLLTGQAMPKGEQSNDASKAGPARKRAKITKSKEIQTVA